MGFLRLGVRLFIIFIIVLVTIGFIARDKILAISNPDLMEIVIIRAFDSVIEEDDMLFVAYYRIDYETIPTERATEAFIARFIDGTTERQATTPFAFVNQGYSDGVFSFYFSSSDVIDFGLVWEGSYTIRLQGNPSLFPVPTVVNSGSINWTSQLVTLTRFREYILDFARDLEVTWAEFTDPDIALIQETPDGTAFTDNGDTYFTNVIPNLRVIMPTLFSGRIVVPDFTERVHNTTYSQDLQNFWDGTSFGNNFQAWADLLNMNRVLLTTLILVAFNIFVAYVSFVVTQQTAFAPLTVAVLFPIGAWIGMTDMILAALMTTLSVVASAYILYLRRA